MLARDPIEEGGQELKNQWKGDPRMIVEELICFYQVGDSTLTPIDHLCY